MKLLCLPFLSLAACLLVVTQTSADVNILVVGSTASYSDGKSDPAEDDAVKEQAFDPTTIATRLQSILANDANISGSVTVTFEDIYRSKYVDTAMGSSGSLWPFTFYCYSLMQYYMWPDGKATRLANLRGESTAWDYVVIMGDPYLMANMPGVFAEGVKLLADEISSGTAEPILLAQWPENSSSFSATNFNEVVYRVGDSAGLRVVPAGKAWNSLTPQDSSSSHPTPDGAYLAAACIYSELYDRSAKVSSYNYDDDIADHALSVVQANQGLSQYTGTYTDINVWQMKYVRKRLLKYCEYGTSTEEGFNSGLVNAYQTAKVGYSRVSGSPSNPNDFTYSRGTDCFEADKQYDYQTRVDNGDRTYGFPIGDHSSTGGETMRYGIDKRYYNDYWYYNGTDLGIAYSMIMTNQVALDVRGVPVRLIWSKMHNANLGFSSHRDGWHLSNELDRGVGAFMFTLVTGRCPIGDEPSPVGSTDWDYWFCRKLGYETAWQMSHLTARAPGFQVFPSSATATNVTPSASEALAVNFAYAPTSDVTVAVSTSDSLAGRASPSVLTFTPQNYSNAQTVTVLGETGAAGSYGFDVLLTTTSGDLVFDGLADTWDFMNTRGDGPSPSDIRISGNGNPIISGDTTPALFDGTDFGVVLVSTSHTFTVENTSASDSISLTNTPPVTLTGGGGHFSITEQAASGPLAAGATTTFDITYTPSSEGSHTATVSVASTDSSVPFYTFEIAGLRPGSLSVENRDTTPVSGTSASISGEMTGGGIAEGWICWGASDGGTSSVSDWDYVVSVGSLADTDQFSTTALGLGGSATYWYRCYLSNVVGEAWSPSAASFNAKPSAPGSEWSPTEIGVECWLDASDTNAVTLNAGNISTLADKSGNSNDAAQVTSGAQPQYMAVDSKLNNMGSVYSASSGSGDYLTTPSFGAKRIYGIMYYGEGTNTTFDNHNGVISGPGTSGEFRLTGRVNQDDWDASNDFCDDNVWKNGDDTVDARNAILPMPTTMWVFNATALRTQTWRILAGNSASWGCWIGGVGELIFTDGSESLESRQKLEGYLAHKWGLEGSLPPTHPYVDAAPGGSGVVVNDAPNGITATSATLRGSIAPAGTGYDVYVHWGTSNGGSNSQAWASASYVGACTNGTTNMSHSVTGLIRGQTYYYTFCASNASDVVWASPSWQFIPPAGGLLTTNHLVPHAWIESTATNVIADHETEVMDDPDGDGFSTWEEYWSGTDPLDADSHLRIDACTFNGGQVELRWRHADADSGLPPLRIETTTNLLVGPWVMAAEHTPTNGVNAWSSTPSQGIFYRLTVGDTP